jgi:hypothetical protein
MTSFVIWAALVVMALDVLLVVAMIRWTSGRKGRP